METFTIQEKGLLAYLGFELLKSAQDLDHLLYVNNLDSLTKTEILNKLKKEELVSILKKVKYTNGEEQTGTEAKI